MSKLSLISIILGIVLLGVAGYMAYSQQQSLSSGVQIEATVESKDVTMDSSKRGTATHPTSRTATRTTELSTLRTTLVRE